MKFLSDFFVILLFIRRVQATSGNFCLLLVRRKTRKCCEDTYPREMRNNRKAGTNLNAACNVYIQLLGRAYAMDGNSVFKKKDRKAGMIFVTTLSRPT